MNKDKLYQDLKKKILTMELEPGSPLDETSLSKRYSISRTPLRDVFQRLAGEGYLTIISNRGASVSSMSHKALRDFFLTAPLIYASVGRLAAENAKPVQIKEMKQAQIAFVNAIKSEDFGERVYWNDRFHALMGEMADNQYLKPSYDRLLIDHARISQTFYRPRDSEMLDRMNAAVEHHNQMIDAIEQGDSKVIVESIIDHWELSRDFLDYFVRPDPLPLELEDIIN
jgi:DNA-binding GntR family transcriptional regulator